MIRNFAVRLKVLLLLLVAVGGCAVIGTAGEGKERRITTRAEARWQYMTKGDFESAYGYLSPSYRASVPYKEYRAQFKAGLWTGAEVKAVKCSEEEVCQVDVEVAYQYPFKGVPIAGKRILRETWRKDSGEWWNVPDAN